jgi:phosphoribosylformylglycinamidine cyclo-ligase
MFLYHQLTTFFTERTAVAEFTYASAGVDIDNADDTKREMARSLETNDARVLNKIGAFATLFDGHFPEYQHPVLVLKSEEPGSKQKLAFTHGHYESVCYDLVNHLINDIIVMGAHPLSLQDVIVCGKMEKDVITRVVDAMAAACRAQDCSLTGGETSEQPGVVPAGTYVLTASVVGVAEKSQVIDGTTIRAGDQVLAVASNGLHTNGYTLVRALLDAQPDLAEIDVDGETFLDAVLHPHLCYYRAVRDLYTADSLHGMAHITGGGVRDNLARVLPADLDAQIDLSAFEIPAIFHTLHQRGQLDPADMVRTFNMGVGLALVVAADSVEQTIQHLSTHDCHAYVIGEITTGEKQVHYSGELTL